MSATLEAVLLIAELSSKTRPVEKATPMIISVDDANDESDCDPLAAVFLGATLSTIFCWIPLVYFLVR